MNNWDKDELGWERKLYTDQEITRSKYEDVNEVEASVLFDGLVVR